MPVRLILAAASSATLLAMLAAPVTAQTPPGEAPAGGRAGGMGPPLTADAVADWSDSLFVRLDANQDAAITGDELAMLGRPEIAPLGGSRLRAMIAQSDTSGDARISREEMAAGARRMFTRLDRNGDGQLADDELPQRPAAAPRVAIPAPQPAPMPFPQPMPDGGAV